MSVLYLSYDGALDPLGGSQVVPVVEGLAERGVEMSLVSFEKKDRLDDREAVEALRERLEGAGVSWRPFRYHRRPSLAATAYDVWRAQATLPRTSGWSAVRLLHARSYVAAVVAHRLARRWNVPWIFDMRGFWVDERLESGVWRPGGMPARLARRFERRLVAEADALVLLTRAGAREVGRLAPDAELPPIRVIPTLVDTERFRPAPDPGALRRELGIASGPVLIYAGSLSTWYLPELTMRVGKAFRERTGGSFVVLTPEIEFAESAAREVVAGATIRSVPHREVPRWLAAADAGLAFVRPSWAKTASAPTKVGEYLACGLAVAATAGVGDLDTQLADSGLAESTLAESNLADSQVGGGEIAFTFDPDAVEPEGIAERLVEAAARPDRRERARELALRTYGLDAGLDAYLDLYEELLA